MLRAFLGPYLFIISEKHEVLTCRPSDGEFYSNGKEKVIRSTVVPVKHKIGQVIESSISTDN